jgi:hypothetical protein
VPWLGGGVAVDSKSTMNVGRQGVMLAVGRRTAGALGEAMKECPSCGAEVPGAATRCKECFHDFSEDNKRSFSFVGPLIALAMVAGMALVAAVVLGVMYVQPVESHTLVDESTRSIIWTTRYRTGVTTDRLMFDEVAKLEQTTVRGNFQLVAITNGGERKVVMEGKEALDGEGRAYAHLMGKPFEDIDPARVLNSKR